MMVHEPPQVAVGCAGRVAIAATERVLERDNQGPRVGFGSKAEVIKK